jgi:hypothetical protein
MSLNRGVTLREFGPSEPRQNDPNSGKPCSAPHMQQNLEYPWSPTPSPCTLAGVSKPESVGCKTRRKNQFKARQDKGKQHKTRRELNKMRRGYTRKDKRKAPWSFEVFFLLRFFPILSRHLNKRVKKVFFSLVLCSMVRYLALFCLVM